MRFLSHSAAQTEEFACDFARGLHGGDVVAFRGGLGMGKTAFVRGALRGLGNTARVSSPTFALVNDYGGTPHIYHFDMYRVTDWDSLYSTGFFDYLTPDSILFIEWSENIDGALPEGSIYVTIEQGSAPDERIITVEGGGR